MYNNLFERYNKFILSILAITCLVVYVVHSFSAVEAGRSINDIQRIIQERYLLSFVTFFVLLISVVGAIFSVRHKENVSLVLYLILINLTMGSIISLVLMLQQSGFIHSDLFFGEYVNHFVSLSWFIVLPVVLIFTLRGKALPSASRSKVLETLYYSHAILFSYVVYTIWAVQTHGLQGRWLIFHLSKIIPLDKILVAESLILLIATFFCVLSGAMKKQYGYTPRIWWLLILINIATNIVFFVHFFSILISQ